MTLNKQSAGTAQPVNERRSSCPLAASLDLVGDRWTLLIVRDLLGGPRRFKDLAAAAQGVSTNVLALRLNRLRQHGLIVRTEAADGGRHRAYRLTDKGEALHPVLAALIGWSVLQQLCPRSPRGHAPQSFANQTP